MLSFAQFILRKKKLLNFSYKKLRQIKKVPR